MHQTLISPDDLAPLLGRDDFAIVDARFYLPEPGRGEAEYLESHLRTAVYAHLDRDLSGKKTGGNGRHPMPDIDQMVDRFSSWGIDESVQVVAYDTAGGGFASRVWWLLRYLGHDAVAVLDGSFRELGDDAIKSGAEARRARTFTPRARPDMRIEGGALQTERERLLLLDARAPERFRGETEPLDPVAGHIPGALNHPFSKNLDGNGRFLPPDELRGQLDSVLKGRDPNEVVCYCGSGVTACHNLLALEAAGIYGAKLYPGSWSEWCADPSRPVEQGQPPGE